MSKHDEGVDDDRALTGHIDMTGAGVYAEAHRKYVVALMKDTESLEFAVTEHLRLSGMYWGLTAMEILCAGDELGKDGIVEFTLKCLAPVPAPVEEAAIAAVARVGGGPRSGFGGSPGHDPHLLHTLSALQMLAMCGALDRLEKAPLIAFVASLQRPDGSFVGDDWGEVDNRFSYCALQALALLGGLSSINMETAVDFVVKCQNFDGGFGSIPGAESHAGQVFCCVGALSIAQALNKIDVDLLGWWLAERQVDSGGLNGRPEKQADVCYSWWILSSLDILGRLDWLDRNALVRFILKCQDEETGGIAERPGNAVDVYHTFFGLAGLALLGHLEAAGCKHAPIDASYALPKALVTSMNLPRQTLTISK